MKHRRNAAITAGIARWLAAPIAIGSLAATAVLSAGLSVASAQQLVPASPAAAPAATAPAGDELNQLRANQQLLQQRLDQLEQVAQVGPAHPVLPPGTASLAGSFPRSFLIPGTDTSIMIGGQAELDVDYIFDGGNPNQTGQGTSILGGPGLSGVALSTGPGANGAARSRGAGLYDTTVYASRLHVETRTPTAWGEANTVIEIDFLGCSLGGIVCNNTNAGQDGLGLRLRLAYATLGPWSFGQSWNVAFDLAAEPERLDTGGTPGDFGVGRMPGIAYTLPLVTPVGAASLAVEILQPEDSAATPNGGTLTNNTNPAFIGGGSIAAATLLASNTAGTIGSSGSNQPLSTNPLTTKAPDLVAALTWHQPWGHLQLHGAVHEAVLKDGFFIDQTYIGYGGGISGDVKPAWLGWAKDDLTFNVFAGDGLGRYAGDNGGAGNYMPYLATNYGAPAGTNPYGAAIGNPCGYGHAGGTVTAACASGIRAATIPEFGATVGYQHWWTPTIRSTVDTGLVHEDMPLALIGPAAIGGTSSGALSLNKTLWTSHINLIWSPVPFVNTGIEYLHGQRTTVYNAKGNLDVLEYAFITKF